jgi:hypothetical protein
VHGGTGEVRILNRLASTRPMRERGVGGVESEGTGGGSVYSYYVAKDGMDAGDSSDQSIGQSILSAGLDMEHTALSTGGEGGIDTCA